MRRSAILLLALAACTQANDKSTRSTAAAPTETVATADQTETPAAEKKPIYLPSQDQKTTGNYPIKGTRPNEVCMEKGFNWLYQGYLQPECGTCHYVGNRFNVTAFGQLDPVAALAVMRTSVDPVKLLEALVTNTFCKGCTMKKEDPLYVDMEYFTRHMNSCEQP